MKYIRQADDVYIEHETSLAESIVFEYNDHLIYLGI